MSVEFAPCGIAVDIGNTRIRIAWIRPRPTQCVAAGEESNLNSPDGESFHLVDLAVSPFPHSDVQAVSDLFQRFPEAAELPWLVASVNPLASNRLRDKVTYLCHSLRWHEITHADLPMPIDVVDPASVGIDRLLAAYAVYAHLAPESAAIVVDAGTATTVDLVSSPKGFRGGAILPGGGLQFESLSRQTAKLPKIEISTRDAKPTLPGRSTAEAIQAGVFWGSVGSIRFLADRLRDFAPEASRGYLTGGWGGVLATELADSFFYVPDLVLVGIAELAQNTDISR